MSVPAGETVAMFIGPICDDCVPHMQGYILPEEDAADIRQQVESMHDSLTFNPRTYSLLERRT